MKCVKMNDTPSYPYIIGTDDWMKLWFRWRSDKVRKIYVGIAVEFDMMTAYAVLAQKKQHSDMFLVAIVPYTRQDVYFKAEAKQRYADVL